MSIPQSATTTQHGGENMDTEYSHENDEDVSIYRSETQWDALLEENRQLKKQVQRVISTRNEVEASVNSLRSAAATNNQVDLSKALSQLGIENIVPTKFANQVHERHLEQYQELEAHSIQLEQVICDLERELKAREKQLKTLHSEKEKLSESNRKQSAEIDKLEKVRGNAVMTATNSRIMTLESETTNLKHVQKDLQSKLQHATSKAESYSYQVEIARAQTKEAEDTNRRLMEMYDLAVVKRSDVVAPRQHSFPIGIWGGSDSSTRKQSRPFPNGDMIVHAVKKSQETLHDYYFFLASLHSNCNGSSSKRDVAGSEVIFDKVIVEIARIAESESEAFVASKKSTIESLLEDDTVLETSRLAKLFWQSTMQRVVANSVASEHFSRRCTVRALRDSERIDDSNDMLTWATSDEVQNHEDMEGLQVNDFLHNLISLFLQCRFSEPPCYLWPPVGAVVSYSNSLHSQQIAKPNFTKKAQLGDEVRVLYPGLYYQNPSGQQGKHASIKPIVKPTVLLFANKSVPPVRGESSQTAFKRVFSNRKNVRDMVRTPKDDPSRDDYGEDEVSS